MTSPAAPRLNRAAAEGLCRAIVRHADAIRFQLQTKDSIAEEQLASLNTALIDLDDVLALIRDESPAGWQVAETSIEESR